MTDQTAKLQPKRTAAAGPKAKVAPKLDLSATEWRLALLAVLAATYAGLWSLLAVRAPQAEGAPPAPASLGAEPPPRVVWLDDLPAGERAQLRLALPPGLTVTTRTAVMAAPPTVTARRVVQTTRLRTRSS
jgi:hypothetical protein